MRKAKCDKGLFGCSNCRNQNRICWVTDPIWLRTERRGALILMRRRIIHLEWLNNCLEQAARSLSSRVKALLQQLQKAVSIIHTRHFDQSLADLISRISLQFPRSLWPWILLNSLYNKRYAISSRAERTQTTVMNTPLNSIPTDPVIWRT